VKVRLWGTRGSLAAAGANTARYGGNTSCVEVRGERDSVIVLDGGTGIRPLGNSLGSNLQRVDVLLTHLHMDHLQGLGFFAPLYKPGLEVHIWGPASTTASLRARLMRYLSPPLFPVHLRDLPCCLTIHEVPCGEVRIDDFTVWSDLVCHPGPTVGYRIESSSGSMAYIPDHEPALGARRFPESREWTSGYAIASGVDLLIHDGQYSREEYLSHIGWGHCCAEDAIKLAELAGVKQLVLFHHDPGHEDSHLEDLLRQCTASTRPQFPVRLGAEGMMFDV
jgi:phosphoribosyl 1,2-cyclic phosphodiesterase